jgi:hypothetical protein
MASAFIGTPSDSSFGVYGLSTHGIYDRKTRISTTPRFCIRKPILRWREPPLSETASFATADMEE